VLAFFVFYSLTRTRDDLMRWISVLNAGLVILTGMVILDPIDPRAFGPAREYVDVGWLTAWLVMVAPLMAALIFSPRSQRRSAIVLLVVGLACLLWLGWLSGNRMVWICFAVIVVISAGIGSRGHKSVSDRMQSYLVVVGLLAIIGLLMAASMQFRAEAETPGGEGPLASVLQDSRAQIWRLAWEMIREHPFAGYGYSNPLFPEIFAAHFDPGWRHLLRHAHNVVLNYTLQMGVTGMVAILFLFATLGWTFITRARRGALGRLAGYCGIALIVGVFLRNSTDDFFSRHAVQFFGAFIGMLLGLATHRPPLKTAPTRYPD
jgi:O-antigen ligase